MAEAAFLEIPNREKQAAMIGQNPTRYALYCLMCGFKVTTEFVHQFLDVTCQQAYTNLALTSSVYHPNFDTFEIEAELININFLIIVIS